MVDDCDICTRLTGKARRPNHVIWQDDLWILRHAVAPHGVAGWLTLYSRRHLPGLPDLGDAEAAALGIVLRTVSRELRQATAAERIYIAALGESCHHFHCHLVPRYADIPPEHVGWNLFHAGARASRDEVVISPDLVQAISRDMADRLGAFTGTTGQTRCVEQRECDRDCRTEWAPPGNPFRPLGYGPVDYTG